MNKTKFEPGDEIKVVGHYCTGYKGVILEVHHENYIKTDLHTNTEGVQCCRIEVFREEEMELANYHSTSNTAMKVLLMSGTK